METRTLGSTGFEASVISLGTRQLGADWGDVNDEHSSQILHASVNTGVTFIDTADVYGDGRSEKTIELFLSEDNGTPSSSQPKWVAAWHKKQQTTLPKPSTYGTNGHNQTLAKNCIRLSKTYMSA